MTIYKNALRVLSALMLVALVIFPFSSFSDGIPADNANHPIQITDASFDETIASGVVLVDFWAIWCRPCRMMTPVIDSLAVKMEGRAVIGKLDVDHNKAVTQRFGISSIPTIIIFKDGKAVKRFVGVVSEASLIAALEELTPEYQSAVVPVSDNTSPADTIHVQTGKKLGRSKAPIPPPRELRITAPTSPAAEPQLPAGTIPD